MAFEPKALDEKAPERLVEPVIEAGEQPKIEIEKIPEAGETRVETSETIKSETAPSAAAQTKVSTVEIGAEKDPELTKIENILAEDLTDIFLTLPEDKRLAFKIKGEEVAKGIKAIIDSGKIKLIKILELIRGWLRMIPGVNKFFLEQEAKIKVDKLMGEFEKKTSSQNEIL